jgi:quercetin dioxygenase-like cupin family protein
MIDRPQRYIAFMRIQQKGERRRAPAEWFTGEVWLEEIVKPEAPSRLSSAYVNFTPGARTNWHTHPIVQVLNVISGRGWVQKEGEPAQSIAPGDIVVIAANENHWHGAQSGDAMTHIAMQEADDSGSPVAWGRPVTDEEYGAAR